LTANPATNTQDIGVFSTSGSTQKVALSGYPTVPMTPQTITFTAPTPVTWTPSIAPIQLVATGGPTGKPVIFSIVSGSGTLSGPNNSILTVKNIGTTVIAANQAGALVNGVYYAAAPQVTQSMVVNPIGVVATPTFSVAAGTYTAAQSVTISDSTAGATIYYTTNGNTPTISSPVYTAGTSIPVNVTTTIKAIAVGAPGYANSPVASATYTLNPDFILKSYVTNFNIPNGLAGGTTLSVAPIFGFTGVVTFSCSGLPAGVTCTFYNSVGKQSASVDTSKLPGATVYATLQINAQESASLGHSGRSPFAPVTALAATVLCFGFRRRKRLATLFLVILSVAAASSITGCSSTGAVKTHSDTFTLTATSGSITHSTQISLVVNNL